MPLYTYKNEAGETIERVVSIEDRDHQDGLTRVITFTGSVYAPTAGGMK